MANSHQARIGQPRATCHQNKITQHNREKTRPSRRVFLCPKQRGQGEDKERTTKNREDKRTRIPTQLEFVVKSLISLARKEDKEKQRGQGKNSPKTRANKNKDLAFFSKLLRNLVLLSSLSSVLSVLSAPAVAPKTGPFDKLSKCPQIYSKAKQGLAGFTFRENESGVTYG